MSKLIDSSDEHRYYERENLLEQMILNLPFAYEETDSLQEIAVRILDSCKEVELSWDKSAINTPTENTEDSKDAIKTEPLEEVHENKISIEDSAKNDDLSEEVASAKEDVEDIRKEETMNEIIYFTREETPEIFGEIEAIPAKPHVPDFLSTEDSVKEPAESYKVKEEISQPEHAEDLAIEEHERGLLFPVFDEKRGYYADKCSCCKRIYPRPHEELNFCINCSADLRAWVKN